jgi:hypothetical protein
MTPAARWLALVHHDLVKRLLWPARDRRDLGGAVRSGELVVRLTDDVGAPIAAPMLWRQLADEAPDAFPAASLEAFGQAVAVATAAAVADELDGVLALEAAFAALAGTAKP